MVKKQYRAWTQDQMYLMPPSMRDWLPEDHLVWFVLDVVSELDISAIEAAIQEKDARGQRPYDPRMMVALLVYAYSSGVYSSRRMAKACRENVAFRVLTGNDEPHFTTINEFRRVHRKCFERLFVEVLLLCRAAGLVKLKHVAVDGTKVEASASKHKAMSYKHLVAEEKRLREEVARMLSEAEAANRAESERAEGRSDGGLPEELRRREDRLARIREAKARLEAEARLARARKLRKQAAGMERTAADHASAAVAKGLRTKAARRRAQADALDPQGAQGAEPATREPGRLPRKETPATPDALPTDGAQRNFTDPESHIMMGTHGFVQAYNAQLAVDDDAQVVVAHGVTNQPVDFHNLEPVIERAKENLGEAPANATADAGYWNPDVEAQARALGTEAWVATARKHGEEVPDEGAAAQDEASPRERMRARVTSEDGRALYARRKAVVEPVNGQIKQARGFRRFSFRGLEAVEAEWALVCACHNLLKLFANRPQQGRRAPRRHAPHAPARPFLPELGFSCPDPASRRPPDALRRSGRPADRPRALRRVRSDMRARLQRVPPTRRARPCFPRRALRATDS